jgi:hypothetical protein
LVRLSERSSQCLAELPDVAGHETTVGMLDLEAEIMRLG